MDPYYGLLGVPVEGWYLPSDPPLDMMEDDPVCRAERSQRTLKNYARISRYFEAVFRYFRETKMSDQEIVTRISMDLSLDLWLILYSSECFSIWSCRILAVRLVLRIDT